MRDRVLEHSLYASSALELVRCVSEASFRARDCKLKQSICPTTLGEQLPGEGRSSRILVCPSCNSQLSLVCICDSIVLNFSFDASPEASPGEVPIQLSLPSSAEAEELLLTLGQKGRLLMPP